MSLRTLLILSAALMLTACATGTQPTPALSWTAPANVMRDCPDLPLAKAGNLAVLIRNHKEVATLYYECQDLNRDKAEVIRNHEVR